MEGKMQQFNTIIADESHMLKGHKAQRTLNIKPHLQRAKHTILMTGTPALSRPFELWTQVCPHLTSRWLLSEAGTASEKILCTA